jgi:hypothetical protein
MKELIIDGITYFEPKKTMTYDEAMEWASTRGLRLLTRGEWCDLFDYKKEFRNSCQPDFYWTATLDFTNPNYACFFSGKFGFICSGSRDYSYTVRAVKADMK